VTERLAFLDTETTGLPDNLVRGNLTAHRILEAAIVVVELPAFRIVAEERVVLGFNRKQPNAPYIDGRVHAMHEASELWAACEATCMTVADAQLLLSRFLVKEGCQGSPLAGNNPDFDRAFLRFWMPALEQLFHYRNFDVNAFWMLDQAVRGDDMGARKAASKHRALDDCRQAVQNVHDHFEFITELVHHELEKEDCA
jgi:oligoribonuclease (3'-5' exoribonuclease)